MLSVHSGSAVVMNARQFACRRHTHVACDWQVIGLVPEGAAKKSGMVQENDTLLKVSNGMVLLSPGGHSYALHLLQRVLDTHRSVDSLLALICGN